MADYPDAREIRTIIKWDIINDTPGFLEFIKLIWWNSGWGYRMGRKKLYLSTGGWSGNEDRIEAMMKNRLFWTFYWESTRRGGHYVFDLTRMIKPKKVRRGKAKK